MYNIIHVMENVTNIVLVGIVVLIVMFSNHVGINIIGTIGVDLIAWLESDKGRGIIRLTGEYGQLIIKYGIVATILSVLAVFIMDREKEKKGMERVELILLATLGIIILVGAEDLLTVYLAMEAQSLAFYTLVGYKRNEQYSAMLILLDVEFLAIIFLIVYVGAVSIFLLFVVMMFNIKLVELKENTTRFIPICMVIAVVFLWQSIALLEHFSNININTVFTDPWFSDTCSLSSPILYWIDWFVSIIYSTNIELLGQALYTDYNFYFLKLAYAHFSFYGTFAHWLGTLAALLTAFYSFRLIYLAFINTPNSSLSHFSHSHEPVLPIMFPLAFLAFYSIFVGYLFKDLFVGLGSPFFSSAIFALSCFLFLFIWTRASQLRIRFDNLMHLGWKSFLPLSLAYYLFTISKYNLVMQPLASTVSTFAITKALLYFQFHPYCIQFVSSAFSIYTFFLQLSSYSLLLAVSTFVTMFLIFFIS